MHLVRRRLPRLAAVWLTCQLAVFATPLGPCCLPLLGIEGGELCHHVSAVEPEDTCPLHAGPDAAGQDPASHHATHSPAGSHGVESPADEGDADACAMRSSCTPTPSAFLSLATGLGVVPAAMVHAIDAPAAPLVVLARTWHGRVPVPDSPPPRPAV